MYSKMESTIQIGKRVKGIRGEKLKEKAIESVGQDFYDIEMEQIQI